MKNFKKIFKIIGMTIYYIATAFTLSLLVRMNYNYPVHAAIYGTLSLVTVILYLKYCTEIFHPKNNAKKD